MCNITSQYWYQTYIKLMFERLIRAWNLSVRTSVSVRKNWIICPTKGCIRFRPRTFHMPNLIISKKAACLLFLIKLVPDLTSSTSEPGRPGLKLSQNSPQGCDRVPFHELSLSILRILAQNYPQRMEDSEYHICLDGNYGNCYMDWSSVLHLLDSCWVVLSSFLHLNKTMVVSLYVKTCESKKKEKVSRLQVSYLRWLSIVKWLTFSMEWKCTAMNSINLK
jgi:hypothetical protein